MGNEVVGFEVLVTGKSVGEALLPALEEVAGLAPNDHELDPRHGCYALDHWGCLVPFGSTRIGMDRQSPLGGMPYRVECAHGCEQRGELFLAA